MQVPIDLLIALLSGVVFTLGSLWRGYCRMFGCGVFKLETDAVAYLMFLIVTFMMYILLKAEIILQTQALLVILGALVVVFLPQIVISRVVNRKDQEDDRHVDLYQKL